VKLLATFKIVVEAEADDASYPTRCKTDEERLESERELADQMGVLGYLNSLVDALDMAEFTEESVTLEAI
jgi:hypothetical protein